MRIDSLLLLLLSFLLVSCAEREAIVIEIDYSSMPCATNGVLYWPDSRRQFIHQDSCLVVIKVIGYNQCTFCELIKLTSFDSVADYLGRSGVEYCTIIKIDASDVASTVHGLDQNYLSFPCFLDIDDVCDFSGIISRHKNCFIIDSYGKVIFSGDLLNSTNDLKRAKQIMLNYNSSNHIRR